MHAKDRKLPRFFVPLPATPVTGSITVTITEDPLKVHLSGSNETTWSTTPQGILLTPGNNSPIHYKLELTLESSSFSLVGLQIFHINANDESTEESTKDATIFLPTSSDHVELNLLYKIPTDPITVVYQLFIGIKNIETGEIHWPDPTISFDPQAGPGQI